MTVEKVKRKLKTVRSLKVRLFVLQRSIDELADEISGVTAIDYTKVKVKTSQTNSVEQRYLKQADRLKALQIEYENIFDELCAVEDELGERMKRLNPTEYKVIDARYISGLYPVSIKSVARQLGYNYESIKKIQQRAFRKMSDESFSSA